MVGLPVFQIFNVHTDVDACSCIQGGCVDSVRQSATGSWHWKKNPLLHQGLEPTSMLLRAFQPAALPTELIPAPVPSPARHLCLPASPYPQHPWMQTRTIRPCCCCPNWPWSSHPAGPSAGPGPTSPLHSPASSSGSAQGECTRGGAPCSASADCLKHVRRLVDRRVGSAEQEHLLLKTELSTVKHGRHTGGRL